MSKKILLLLDHLRVEHVIEHRDGTMTIDFLQTKMGKLLKKKLKTIGLNVKDIDIDYIYPEVPEPKAIDNKSKKPTSYKDVPVRTFKQQYPRLNNLIIEGEYDLVIPTGRMGCKYLLDQVSITKLAGIPEWTEVSNAEEDSEEEGETHEFWVYPMLSMEYIDFKRNAEITYDASLGLLETYLKEGDNAFIPTDVNYEFIDNIERVREYFKNIKDNKLTSAWDLETNTLRYELKGAKAIVLSISHEENQGVTIPLDHKEFEWKPEERAELLELFQDYVSNEEIYKVGQNISYDIGFMYKVYGFDNFRYNLDTKVAYYLTVSQEEAKSFKLTDLAYEMTDMGGYDKPLDDWMKNYKEEYKEEHGKFPVNEVDGSNVNYEWFPLREQLAPYASGDVDATLRIHNVLKENIHTRDKWKHQYYDFYPRLTESLAIMRATGFKVNEDKFDEYEKAYKEETDRLLEAIREQPAVQQLEDENRQLYEEGLKEWAKPKKERDPDLAKLRDTYKKKLEFNPGSYVEKGRLLFDVLGIEPPKNKDTIKPSKINKDDSDTTWEDYRTDANMMKWIAENVPEAKKLAELFLERSKVEKLLSTYVVGMRDKVNPETGLIHGTFTETGTGTSRLSAKNPK